MPLQADEEGPVSEVYGGLEDGGEGDAVAECVSMYYEEAFGGWLDIDFCFGISIA